MSNAKKAAYTTGLFVAFFCFYFVIQFIPQANKIDILFEIDKLIPLMPEFIWIYWSLPLQIFFAMVLIIQDRNLFFETFWSCIVASLLAFGFYLTLPIHYPREAFELATLSSHLLELTRSVDKANNTFPSSHVIFTWLMYISTARTKLAGKYRGLSLLFMFWTVGITVSTLAVKQHFIVDAAFGCFLSFLIFYLVNKIRENWIAPSLVIYR
jgi:membrane-associated phospholipid phosphatase